MNCCNRPFDCRTARGASGVSRGLRIAIGLAALFGASEASLAAATFDCVLEPSLTVKLAGARWRASLQTLRRSEETPSSEARCSVAHLEYSVEQVVVAYNRARAESTAEIEAKQVVLAQNTRRDEPEARAAGDTCREFAGR